MTTAAPPIAAENRAAAAAFAGSVATPGLRGAAVVVGRKTVAREGTGLPVMAFLILMGLVTLAACVLIPLREERRQLQYALDDLQAQRDYVQQQAAANAGFIQHVQTDPALAERLTMRFTRRPADGKRFLDDGTLPSDAFSSSPYSITQIAAPAARDPYVSDLPVLLAKLMSDTKSRLILMGAALFAIVSAVVLGRESEGRMKAEG